MIGQFVISKAGHDKGEIYVIVAEEKDFVYLSDGRLKLPEKPKKKRKKHIQPIKQGMDEAITEKLKQEIPVRNEEVKKVIKDFIRKKEASDV